MARIQTSGSLSGASRGRVFNGFHGLALIFALATLLAWLSYRVIGVQIDPNNVLQEAFYLIPMGYLAALLSVVSVLIAEWRRLRGR